MKRSFFPQRPKSNPIIYAYSDTRFPGMFKVGYTERAIEERMKEHYPTLTPTKSWNVELVESAMKTDGSVFMDHDVHRVLEHWGIKAIRDENDSKSEWFKCTVQEVLAAIMAVKTGNIDLRTRSANFAPRPEQSDAVDKTYSYFEKISSEKEKGILSENFTPKFLWNCKMRFGKTFASYLLAQKMSAKRVLVLTFKPAVQSAWQEDLETHVLFEGWQFVSREGRTYEECDKSKPIVCFGSFQDFLGTNENGGIKARNEWVHTTNWDLVIFDEYHFGAWRENAKKLFESEDEENLDKDTILDNTGNNIDETWLPITTSHYLFLSGTPFRALNSGEFIEEQIFSWTYSDEQREKENWNKPEPNPYASLPRMVMMTYQIPESIKEIARRGENNEFDLNYFFEATGEGKDAQFRDKEHVQKWLDLIRGSYLPSNIDDMKLGEGKKPPMPFSDTRLLSVLNHTVWLLPGVASCFAMANLLKEKQNTFFHDYKVIVCAGTGAGVGMAALEPVQIAMDNPLETKTITLSCGKLMTGVTVKPWTGIFMLCNLRSPETYFQSAFRVQSPWEIKDSLGKSVILKKECYIFDFALDRALKQISDYSRNLNTDPLKDNPQKLVEEFISYLPVLAYDGSTMKQINATEILDMAMSGTSATLLAKRWESALLVNVDNETLDRLMNNPEAMKALESIEGFRNLNSDIQTIINKSEAVKKAKKEKQEKMTQEEKKIISEEEKEYKSKRKQIQEKLIKFATRIPVFMYLTDYREHCLRDVITQLEPGLFKKVTGLNLKDFELLVSLNVFNGSVMNDAIFKFRSYEDSSLSYTGIDRHEEIDKYVGGFDTVITTSEFEEMR
ncbi:MAG: GIY-YIG nuclease family protein [Treponemataceae bacterium]|nr:GIY-YIG nuclease family protein [Spirochaetales bacterium]MDY6030856.1 GIY-YIG nuclease family protein [Treponemataceae bacterium]